MKNLTERQRRFIEHYVATGKGKDSAEAAGYSNVGAAVTAYKLLHNPQFQHVRDEIQRRMDMISEELQITAEDVRREIWQALQVAKSSVTPVVSSKTGKPIKDEEGNALYKVDLGSWLRACELLGKLTSVGAFRENVSISIEDDLIRRLQKGRDRLARGEED